MRVLSSIAILAMSAAAANAAVLFTENFGNLADGTTVVAGATPNTNLDYVRVGSGGGSIKAKNPSTLGSGASGLIAGPTSTSLNGIGKTSFTASSVASLQLSFKLLNADGGDFFVGLGSGATFTGNGTFSTADLMFGIQNNNGNLEYRTTGWNSFSPAVSLSDGIAYTLTVISNRSGSTVPNPNGGTVATGKMDVYLNGALIGDDLTMSSNQNAAAFRFYSVSQAAATDTIELDNILVDSSAILVPEPASLGLLGLASLVGLRRRSR